MVNESHLAILKQGVEVWNKWRKEHPEVSPDLSEAFLPIANLRGANLSSANLRGADLFFHADLLSAHLSHANLRSAHLSNANLYNADLSHADLSHADLSSADLCSADLSHADLSSANLYNADLSSANLYNADLSHADLVRARLVETNITGATFTACRVYGISVWNLQGEPKEQNNLLITRWHPIGEYREPALITVDNLHVAQFIYLLIHYPELNKVIDTITSKVVLILGRFSNERKPTLEAMRDALRYYDLVPVMFVFDRPSSKTFIETVSTIANMARFVIADFTDPKIVLQEASEVVRNSNVPVQPLLLKSCEEPVTLLDLKAGRRTILPTFVYENDDHLIRSLKESIIKPANERVEQLIAEKQKIFEEFEKNLKLERERKPVVSEDTNDHALLHQVSIADEIQEAIALRDAGELTQEQFEEYKKRLLY